jgi:plastocyanin
MGKQKFVAYLTVTLFSALPVLADGGSHYKFRYVKTFESRPINLAKATGTGVIEGKVIYTGKRKLKNRRKLITKDKEVCGRGYKIDKVYEISQKGEVKNAVVFVEGSSDGKKVTKVLVQERCEFSPRVVAMYKGSALEIVNRDATKHEANGVQDYETIFQLSQPKKGMKDRVILEKPGVVEITCNIHGWMKAWVVVSGTPFYAVTDSGGNFRISGLPPGEYTLRVWHEGLREKKVRVKVEEGKVSTVSIELR